MFRIRLFCTISIFLCALYSGSAQDWESVAVDCERIIYDGAGLEETNSALLRKAECYRQLGRHAESAETLSRVRMFALTPEERAQVLYQQELSHFLAGDFEQASAMVPEVLEAYGDSLMPLTGSSDGLAMVGGSPQEALLLHALSLAYAGKYDDSQIMAARCISWNGESPYLGELQQLYRQRPAVRSLAAATVLSFLPPAGHFYNEAYGEGLLSLGLNAASAALMAVSLAGGYWFSGIAGGAIALNYSFMGNLERNQALVEKHNNNAPLRFGDSLRELLSRALSDER